MIAVTAKTHNALHRIVRIVLCCLALSAAVSSPSRAFAASNDQPIVVTLGDSYSSGEGTEDFYYSEYIAQKDYITLYSKDDFLAHRSKLAWAGQLEFDGVPLSKRKDDGWYFLAISGAVTDTILKDGVDQDNQPTYGRINKEYGVNAPFVSRNLNAQIDELDARIERNEIDGPIDYVTMTLGGNDVGFADIVKYSIANAIPDNFWVQAGLDLAGSTGNPLAGGASILGDIPLLSEGNLSTELLNSIETFEGETKYRLEDSYHVIRDEVGDQAQIIVAGYPHLFPATGSKVDLNISGRLGFANNWVPAGFIGVSANDARIINAACDVFDEGIELIVTRGVEEPPLDNISFVDVRDAFDAAGDGCINPVMLMPNEQDIKQAPPSAYSVHPSEKGQKVYAETVQKKIDELEEVRLAHTNDSADDTPEEGSLPDTTTNANQAVDLGQDVAISIVVDSSGSMDEYSAYGGMTKLESAKQQSTGFVNGSVRSEGGAHGLSARVGVVGFSGDAWVGCGLSQDPATITSAINQLEPLNMTNMYAGLEMGISQLESQGGTKIMMYLSDGLSNVGPSSAEILDLAHEAADKGITIYTIGFGQDSDLDEALLREMAEITGGSYSHEDPSSVSAASVGLFASMMDAQLRETQQLLMSTTGSVQQGATVQAGTYTVDTYGTLTCYLYWPGSVLDLQLTDPDGVTVEDGYEGYTLDTSTIPTRITIENAKQGEWDMAVYGRETSMDDEPFYAAAALVEGEESEPTCPSGYTGGGGAATDNSSLFMFLLAVCATAGIAMVYAMSKRR